MSQAPGAGFAPEYAELLDAMPDGMVVTDERGRIVYVNGLLAKMSGYEPDDLVGEPVEVLVPERFRAPHQEHRHAYYETGEPTRPMGAGLDISLRRADGSEIPTDISLSPAVVNGTRFVLAAVRDISERRQAEALIRENERRWNELLENVQLAVVGLDLAGRVNYVNPFFLKLTGYTEDEVRGANWIEVFVPEHEQPEIRATFDDVVGAQDHRYHENDIVTRAGRRRTLAWFNTRLRHIDGRPIGTISVGADVTERRQAEARARALNEVAQAILGRGGLEAILTQVSRSAAKLVGATTGAVIRAAGDRLVMRAAAGRFAEQIRGRTAPLEDTVAGEVMATGRAVAVESLAAYPASPIHAVDEAGPAAFVPLWARGEVFGVLAVVNERGGRRFDDQVVGELETFGAQASVALEYGQSQAQLQRMTLLEDRERIARELHDTVIQQLFATGMRLQALAAPAGAAALDPGSIGERVNAAVSELDEVIDEIRSTIFALESSERGVGTVRARAVSLVEEATRGLGFEPVVRFVGAIETLPDDVADQMLAALREALSNVARHAQASHVDVTVAGEDDLLVRVVDDGIGPPSDLVAGDGAGGASGLGLRNMRRRAEDLGGTLSMSPAPKGGTVVEWRVPLTPPST